MMNKMGIPISHGYYTPLVLKTALHWADTLGMLKHVFHVINVGADLEISDTINHEWKMKVEEIRDIYISNALKKTYRAVDEAGGDRKLIKDSSIICGKIIDSILKEVKDKDLSFLVLGPKTHNEWGELFLGSTTERLLKATKIPILVVKNEDVVKPKNVFWATDLLDSVDESLKWIIKLNQAFSINLTICHVKTNENFQQKLNDIENELNKIKCPFQVAVIDGAHKNVGELIVKETQQNEYDLIVFGAKRKQSILSLFLGSTEEYLIHNIDKSFLLINHTS